MLSKRRNPSDAGSTIGVSPSSSNRSDFTGSTAFPLWDDSRLPKLPDYFQQRPSGFISKALRQSALWDACRRKLQKFDPLLIDPPIEEACFHYSAPDESWDALVDRLQAQIDRLAQGPVFDVEQFDRIGSTITALRAVNVNRHMAWMESFFLRLKNHCGKITSLDSMIIDIEVLQHACMASDISPARMREILLDLGNTIELNSEEYKKTDEVIRDKESLLNSLNSSISAVSLQERQDLRRREKSFSDELNGLRLKLIDIESTLSRALNDCLTALPVSRHCEGDEPESEQWPNSSEGAVETPTESPSTPASTQASGPPNSVVTGYELADITPILTNTEARRFDSELNRQTQESGTQPSTILADPYLQNPQHVDDYIASSLREIACLAVPGETKAEAESEVSFVNTTLDLTTDSIQTTELTKTDGLHSSLQHPTRTDELPSVLDASEAFEVGDSIELDDENIAIEISRQTAANEIKEQVEQALTFTLTDSIQSTANPEEETFSESLPSYLQDRNELEQNTDTPEAVTLDSDSTHHKSTAEPAGYSTLQNNQEITVEEFSIPLEKPFLDIELPEPSGTGEASDAPDETQEKDDDSKPETFFGGTESASVLLANLSQISAWLSNEEWSELGHLQWHWLERRQPLRAWILADMIETNLQKFDTKLIHCKKGLPEFSFLPSWACYLLMSISDPQLPWLDNEMESLNRVGDLSDEYKELVTLWLTASLFEGLTSKPLQAVRSVSPNHYALQPGSLAHFCAEHILKPIHNAQDTPATAHDYEQAVASAKEILRPVYNDFQNQSAKAYWKKLTDPDGLLGRICAITEYRLFSSPLPAIVEEIKSAPEWMNVDSISRRDMLNRVAEFTRLIELARATHESAREDSNAEPLAISQQAVDLIINSIQRNDSGGWWLEAIKAGVATL